MYCFYQCPIVAIRKEGWSCYICSDFMPWDQNETWNLGINVTVKSIYWYTLCGAVNISWGCYRLRAAWWCMSDSSGWTLMMNNNRMTYRPPFISCVYLFRHICKLQMEISAGCTHTHAHTAHNAHTSLPDIQTHTSWWADGLSAEDCQIAYCHTPTTQLTYDGRQGS